MRQRLAFGLLLLTSFFALSAQAGETHPRAARNAMVMSAQLNALWSTPDESTLLAGGNDGALWASEDHATHWHQTDMEGDDNVFRFVGTNDGSIIFALAEGSLQRSTDKGRHWNRVSLPKGHFVSDVLYLPSQHSWIASTGLGILKSSDDSRTWKVVFRATRKAPFLHLALSTGGMLIAGGGLGQLASSADGTTWRPIATKTDAILMHLVELPDHRSMLALWHDGSFTRIDYGTNKISHGDTGQTEAPYTAILDSAHQQVLVGTAQGEILRTSDGNKWERSLIADRAYVTDIQVMPKSGDIYTVGARANIARSTDGGKSWQLLRGNEWSSRLTTLHITSNGDLLTAGTGGLMLKSVDHGNSWQTLRPDLNRYISDIHSLPTPGGLMLAGYDGLLARSEDGGETWGLVDTGMTTTLSLQTLVEDRAKGRLWATAPLSTVLLSKDQGKHWQARELGESGGGSFLLSLAIDGSSIVAMGNPGPIIRSVDDGNTWQVTDAPAGESGFAALISVEHDVFLAARNDGNIIRSSDKGASWKMIGRISPSLSALQLDASSGAIWAMGPDSFMRSDDKGLSWKPVALPKGAHVGYLLRSEVGTLLGFGDRGSIVRSSDDGKTWKAVGLPGTSSLRKPLIDPKNSDIWVPGRDGTLLHSQDDGQHWVRVATHTRAHLNRLAIDEKTRSLLVTGERIVRLPLD